MADELDLTMLDLTHAALRRDLARLAAGTTAADVGDGSRLAALRQQWRLFAE
jgi:hypothetical protein